MRYVDLRRLEAAVNQMLQLEFKRTAAVLAGFFGLKQGGITSTGWTTVSPTDFADALIEYYGVTGAPRERPYFDPIYRGWKNDNWPRGSTFTALERKSTPLRRDPEALLHKGRAENTEWKLQPGYEERLLEYLPSHEDGQPTRIPAVAFALWIFRYAALPDDITASTLVTRLKTQLKLTQEEFDALFHDDADEVEDSLFTDEQWEAAELLTHLPAQPALHDASAAEDEEVVATQEIPTDDELLANLMQHLAEDNFEVSSEFVANFLTSLRVDRFVMLVGKPGTGKTEFVRNFTNALNRTLGGAAGVHLIEFGVSEETSEHDLIGYRDLAGRYVPSRLMLDLNKGNPDKDLYFILLDEANLASMDSYAVKLLGGIISRLGIDLPGTAPDDLDWFPQAGRWIPHNGVLLVATMNSYLEDASRAALSTPVKRRGNPISMPDPLTELVEEDSNTSEQAPPAFNRLLRLLLDQAAGKIDRRGASVLDGDKLTRLEQPIPDEVAGVLWKLVRRLASHAEIPMTLGLLQTILGYMQTSTGDQQAALDLQIEQKILPMLSGSIERLDEITPVLTEAGLTRSLQTVQRMRVLADESMGIIRPLF